jgi:hypothetical protein
MLPLLALGACGDDSARIAFNEGVAALRSSDLVAAEIAAEKAAARGGPGFEALRDFLLGCAAFTRCEREEIGFFGPAGGAAALDRAIVHAERARDFWQGAAARRTDWPEVRRNVERALLKLEELRKKRAAAESQPGQPPQPKPRPRPTDKVDPPRDPGADRTQARRVDPQLAELAPDQVKGILEKLTAKEKEKVRLRQAQRQARQGQVEKDW